MLDSDKTRSEMNKFEPRRKIAYITIQKFNVTSKTMTENTNMAVSVYDEKLYLCKNPQTTLTCSVVTLACLVATPPVISMI